MSYNEDEVLLAMAYETRDHDSDSHSLIPRIQECSLYHGSPPISIMDMIYKKQWNETKELIKANPECVYQTCGRYNRLVIHELCKIVTFPLTPDSKGEISDDDDDEEVAEVGFTGRESLKHENEQINLVVKEMIEASHRLGPVRVVVPADDNEDENDLENEHEAEGGDNNDNEINGDDLHYHHHAVEPQPVAATVPDVESEDRFQVHESILTVADKFGKTPLHVLCENSADTSMMKVILSCTIASQNTGCNEPQSLSAPSALSLISSKDLNGSTPLHYLSYSRVCPFSSIKLMMDYSEPQQISQSLSCLDPTLCTDMDGDTPLHWALDGYMSPRRIKQLIRYNKQALWVQNRQGRRPMDQFVDNFVDSDWYLHELCGREVWENIQGYLRVLREGATDDDDDNFVVASEERNSSNQDSYPDEEKKQSSNDDATENKSDLGQKETGKGTNEWLPVHTIGGSSIDFPPIFLDIALHYNKEDLNKKDHLGNLPLHLACGRVNIQFPHAVCDGTVAKKILTECPQAAYKPSRETKRLAIHIAVESQKPLSLISSLIKAYPNSLNIQDPVTALWPFLLAGSSYSDSLDVSYSLLRADPSIMHICLDRVLRKQAHSRRRVNRLFHP